MSSENPSLIIKAITIIKPNSLPDTYINQQGGRSPSIRMKRRTAKVPNISIKSDPPFGILKMDEKKHIDSIIINQYKFKPQCLIKITSNTDEVCKNPTSISP